MKIFLVLCVLIFASQVQAEEFEEDFDVDSFENSFVENDSIDQTTTLPTPVTKVIPRIRRPIRVFPPRRCPQRLRCSDVVCKEGYKCKLEYVRRSNSRPIFSACPKPVCYKTYYPSEVVRTPRPTIVTSTPKATV